MIDLIPASLMGPLTLVKPYFSTCEMGQATHASWAFSREHQVPVAMALPHSGSSVPESLSSIGCS